MVRKMLFIFSTIKKLFNSTKPAQLPSYMTLDQRIEMTISCRDTNSIPKVSNAGEVLRCGDTSVQVMHNGTKIRAGEYCGEWITKIIAGLKGHHEPQEELIFYHILKLIKPGCLMIELGSWWAYHTSWFLSSVNGGRAICVEPDKNNLEVGRNNLKLNDQEAIFINATIGGYSQEESTHTNESDGASHKVPCLDFVGLLDVAKYEFIELIHMDIQGAELAFLESMEGKNVAEKVRFIFISTHHETITGSSTTHEDCISKLINIGAVILVEHSIHESFSGDGLIVASFKSEDKNIILPEISKNTFGNSLFCNSIL